MKGSIKWGAFILGWKVEGRQNFLSFPFPLLSSFLFPLLSSLFSFPFSLRKYQSCCFFLPPAAAILSPALSRDRRN